MKIRVHRCANCGDHTREHVLRDVSSCPGAVGVPLEHAEYVGEAVDIVRCPDCGNLVCRSCLSERACCARVVELEQMARAIVGKQMPLFKER